MLGERLHPHYKMLIHSADRHHGFGQAASAIVGEIRRTGAQPRGAFAPGQPHEKLSASIGRAAQGTPRRHATELLIARARDAQRQHDGLRRAHASKTATRRLLAWRVDTPASQASLDTLGPWRAAGLPMKYDNAGISHDLTKIT